LHKHSSEQSEISDQPKYSTEKRKRKLAKSLPGLN